jgi:hypothetical protein
MNEKKRFEAWADQHYGSFRGQETEVAWSAWQAALAQRTDQQAEPVAWWVNPPYLDGNHITTDPYEQVRLASRSDVTVRPLVFGNAAPPVDPAKRERAKKLADYCDAFSSGVMHEVAALLREAYL